MALTASLRRQLAWTGVVVALLAAAGVATLVAVSGSLDRSVDALAGTVERLRLTQEAHAALRRHRLAPTPMDRRAALGELERAAAAAWQRAEGPEAVAAARAAVDAVDAYLLAGAAD